jgi:hypothetical protein
MLVLHKRLHLRLRVCLRLHLCLCLRLRLQQRLRHHVMQLPLAVQLVQLVAQVVLLLLVDSTLQLCCKQRTL